MPSLGADMDTGTVTSWLVHAGDTVHRGQIVAIVETDKADVEVEVFEDGVVDELLVPEGVRVDVGTPLARLAPSSTSAPPKPTPTRGSARTGRSRTSKRAKPAAGTRRRQPSPRPTAKEAGSTHWVAPVPPTPAAAPSAVTAPVAPTRPRPSAARTTTESPLVRRRAAELGVDLSTVTGTGKDGALTRADVERAAAPGPAAAPPAGRAHVSPRARRLAAERDVELADLAGTGPDGAVTGDDVEAADLPGAAPAPPSTRAGRGDAMRAAIARAMSRSKREIPHYYLAHEMDFSTADAFLRDRNATSPVAGRVLPAALLLKATALGVRRTPELNGFWIDDALHVSDAVHLGVAISLRGGGLVAPAIHDADQCTLDELMAALRDLVNRARAGSLRASELSDPTITVTNLGDQGVQLVHGAIYPPQVALVGFGAILERPWASHGMVGARPVVTGTLAADHRASDGARGALLLKRIDSLLQEPTTL